MVVPPPRSHPWPRLQSLGSVAALHRHAFDDGEERVDCGSAVLVAHEGTSADSSGAWLDDEDGGFSAAQAAQFLAGGPLTLGWVTPSPSRAGSDSVYVYCWVTIGD
jgi:hypothetical protein